MTNKKVLAVGAHPDDIELGCAGTLSKLIKEGWDVTCLIMVDPHDFDDTRPKEVVYREFENSFSILDIKDFDIVFTSPIIEKCILTVDSDSVEHFESITEVYNTEWDLVITHHNGDSHQDHKNTSDIVYSFCRKNVKELWFMESALYFNRNKSFQPNVFVGIDKHIDTKIESLSCYDSYMNQARLNLVVDLARIRGGMTTDKHAEAFQQMHRIL